MEKIPYAKTRDYYDVVIVGAGPAGLIIAKSLSQDLKVLIVDRVMLPREKPCGGVLKRESLSWLRDLNVGKGIFAKPKNLDLRYLDWDNDLEKTEKRGLLNLSRFDFDYKMLNQLPDNVDCCDQLSFLNFEIGHNLVNVNMQNVKSFKNINCEYLIGASGASYSVRKVLNNGIPRNSYIAIQEVFENMAEIKEFLYILDTQITDFYSWVIPKGGRVLVGSAFPTYGAPYRSRFELLKKKIKDKFNLYGLKYKTEAALLIKPNSLDEVCLGTEKVILVGEEAGLISPTTAEGISFALRSGYNCAKALNNMEDVSEMYKNSCKEMTSDIKSKLEKAELLFDPQKRVKLLKSGKLANRGL